MKCTRQFALLALIFVTAVEANDSELKNQVQALTEKIEIIKTLHLTDTARLMQEIQHLKHKCTNHVPNTHDRNEHVTLQWAKSSMKELRSEIHEVHANLNNSELLQQLHDIRNELKQSLMETADLAQLARNQEARIDKLDSEASRLKYENGQFRSTLAEFRSYFHKLANELKSKQEDAVYEGYNEIYRALEANTEAKPEGNHVPKYRHNKMIHSQISRLARTQEQLDAFQQSMQTQLLDAQRRLDRYEEANWYLLSSKVDFLEVETKSLRCALKNISQKVSDFDKVHASMLELREDIESIENKADKTVPEFRKEISKLDVNFAQLNAQSSYLKEDQENLRQSVKAIAVSVSNTIDRAEMDRLMMKKVNDSVAELTTRSKQHFHRLNDHISKSEDNHDTNGTEGIPLPQLMGEVKELQPVEREYEDLVKQLPRDCSNISGPAGIYLVHPGQTPFETWCSNGSTLLQRRFNGSIEFNRKFAEYAHGFGDPAAEYWLGLETMHTLTADNCSSMRIDMTDIYGGVWYAEYEHFSVGDADGGFVLAVAGFKGNASDAFEYQNHMEFSTIDRDRDTSNTHCAANYEGGWWFSHCQHVNINGKYTLGLTWFDSVKNEWIAVATSEMRLFRRPGCS